MRSQRKQGPIPTESALAVEKGGRYQPPKRCLNHGSFFVINRSRSLSAPRSHREAEILSAICFCPLANWKFYSDGALDRGEGSYFVLLGTTPDIIVLPPRSIEVLYADLRWRSFFWSVCLR